MPQGENALVTKLSNFVRLSPDELDCLTQLQSKPERVRASTDIVYEGQVGHDAYILQSGWAFCYKLLPDGGRQVITFCVPGDFMGLRSVLLRTSDHSFAALTDSVVSSFSVKLMTSIFSQYPRIGAAVLWAISRDEAMVVEHLVGVGRRSAIERVAHFFLELGDRLQLVGMASPDGFAFPLNQYLLSDAVGLTAIHTNRVLRHLREKGLVSVKEHRVEIKNVRGLMDLAGYDGSYLDQSRSWPKIDD